MYRMMLFLVLVPLRGTSTFDAERFTAFMQKASRLDREYHGCPDAAVYREQCEPAKGKLDYKLMLEVWNDGHKLFN